NPDQMNDGLITCIAQIIYYFSNEAASYEAALIENLSENQKSLYLNERKQGKKINFPYSALTAFDYNSANNEPMKCSPIQYVEYLQEKKRLEARGFFYNERNY